MHRLFVCISLCIPMTLLNSSCLLLKDEKKLSEIANHHSPTKIEPTKTDRAVCDRLSLTMKRAPFSYLNDESIPTLEKIKIHKETFQHLYPNCVLPLACQTTNNSSFTPKLTVNPAELSDQEVKKFPDRYQLVEVEGSGNNGYLGAGIHGSVYSVKDKTTGAVYALKVAIGNANISKDIGYASAWKTILDNPLDSFQDEHVVLKTLILGKTLKEIVDSDLFMKDEYESARDKLKCFFFKQAKLGFLIGDIVSDNIIFSQHLNDWVVVDGKYPQLLKGDPHENLEFIKSYSVGGWDFKQNMPTDVEKKRPLIMRLKNQEGKNELIKFVSSVSWDDLFDMKGQ